LRGAGEGNKSAYIEHIGLFFFFVACAGVSIIVWVFNWICWRNQCCCCDFLHNPINKRIIWWTCFIFLLGLLACCISGFVTTNRFGFALQGSYCSFERFYYDSMYGQLKETYPRWEGFENLTNILNTLNDYILTLDNDNYNRLIKDWGKKANFADGYYSNDFLSNFSGCLSNNSDCQKAINSTLPLSTRYGKIIDSYYKILYLRYDLKETQNLNYLSSIIKNMGISFSDLNRMFLNEFYYFARIANGWGRILTMIYFCLLLIAVTFAGFSMMFYVCLRNQGYLAIFMHVLWNIIRFFIFSFFFYGAAYGMCYLALRDAVAYVTFVFGEENLKEGQNAYLVPNGEGKTFLRNCLINNNTNFKNIMNDILTSSLEDYFKNTHELGVLLKNKNSYRLEGDNFKSQYDYINEIDRRFNSYINNRNNQSFNYLGEIAVRQGGLFGSFDCDFLKSDLAMMYRTLYDMSVEARILCALSCCIGFFGAVAVYFFLLVLHHYNMDLFFDSGQSIFTIVDGNTRRKKISNKDPAYKKRKIRSEIELSSRNEEYSGVNKNED
jgi:hypothetical protein